MEKKYIIKLEENEIAYKTVNSNGCPMIGLLHPAPYTEPDLEQVRKEAYQQGYEHGYKDGLTNGKDFQVGDEIKAVSGKAVVVYADDVKVQYVYSNGAYAFDSVGNVTKTGRHFPEMAEVLEKIRGE